MGNLHLPYALTCQGRTGQGTIRGKVGRHAHTPLRHPALHSFYSLSSEVINRCREGGYIGCAKVLVVKLSIAAGGGGVHWVCHTHPWQSACFNVQNFGDLCFSSCFAWICFSIWACIE